MRDGKVVFGVAGAGFIGKRHIAMIAADPESELGGVCDILSAEECDLSRVVPGRETVSTIGEMIERCPEIDIVSICTPNGLHAQMAIDVLGRDRSVLIEKPLALSVADALKIKEAEKASKGRVFTVFQNRYTPTSEWAKSLMRDGFLGRLTQVVVNCMWNRDERYYKPGHWHGTADLDGGTLFTQFSHYVDILVWLVGPVKIENAIFADHAHQKTTDFEDTGAILFTTREGATGTFTYTTAVPDQNLESSIILVGTQGSIKIGGQYMSEVSHCRIRGYEMPRLAEANPPNDYGAYKGSAANHCYVIRNVCDVLLRGEKPTANIEDGIRVVETIESVYSFRTGDYSRR
ncbi:MAG: Gfo/Idh/MocA family oxidoreductase [Bacteroidales bacterium]|nr:Gfo/Idh/MocA family oxidoreductase [Bacteroidales bacterium]